MQTTQSISKSTQIEQADISLLKKAGLFLDGVLELRTFKIVGGLTMKEEVVDDAGIKRDSKQYDIDAFNIEDGEAVYQSCLTPNPRNRKLILGDWRNGLSKDEREHLIDKYGLPEFKFDIPNEDDTYVSLKHGMVFNLKNLNDCAMYNVIKHLFAVAKSPELASEVQPFYFVSRKDVFDQRKALIQTKKRIMDLLYGENKMSVESLVECYEYLSRKYTFIVKEEDQSREMYHLLMEELVQNNDSLLRYQSDIVNFAGKNGQYLLYIERLKSLGLLTVKMNSEKNVYEYSMQDVKGYEDVVATNEAEMIDYLRSSRNANILERAKAFSPFNATDSDADVYVDTQGKSIDEKLGVSVRQEDEEDDESVLSDKSKPEQIHYAPISEVYNAAAITKTSTETLDVLMTKAADDGVISEEVYGEYNKLTSKPAKRATIKKLFVLK